MPISPNQGPTSGGTTVTITGVNLSNAVNVKFGLNNATITANTPTSVTVVSPSGTGVVNVCVTTNSGSSNYLTFYYIPPPIAISISPTSGPFSGGNTVIMNGYNLATATSINFGVNSITPTVVSDGEIYFIAPATESSGSINISVVTTGGTSSSLPYMLIDSPYIDSLSPTSGSINGGTNVTIQGNNFNTTTSVSFGGVVASYGIINSTLLSVITPPNTAGSVDVVITTTAGSATAASAFTYISSPGI